MPLTLKALNEILTAVETRWGTFRTGDDGASLWLQFVLKAPDYTLAAEAYMGGVPVKAYHGRKWRISRHMTKREVVGTAFAAVMAATEHEVREGFKWHGLAVFGPHIPLDALARAAEEIADARA